MSTPSKEILMFKFEEPFAMCVCMGQSAEVVFVYEHGDVENAYYNIFQNQESYTRLKEEFPILKDCYWSGPDGEDTDFNEVVIRTSPGEGSTRVPKGYKHFYIGGGSHLVIREDKYDAYVNACGDLADKENRYKLDFDGWMKFVPALFEDEKTQAEDM